MPLHYVDWIDDAVLRLVSGLAVLVSIGVLADEGVRHILSPASSKLASWLGMVNLPVAAGPELSLGGLFAVLVILVGGVMVVTVFVAAYALLDQVLDM